MIQFKAKMKKYARTISGVTPLAVMTSPAGCPGKCVYCPTYPEAPQSYTPESPAVIRARQCDYNASRQVEMRLKTFAEMGHPTDKIELIIMGGTFLARPLDYQCRFIKECYDGLNGFVSATLEEAKQYNETARHRCTGLCIETRPDWCGPEEIERMLRFGTTRVELGVQTLSDDILNLVGRGHGVAETVRATALLRQSGFKVYYHWMPGLPGATPEKDFEMAKHLFEDARFRPDGLKIYPTMVVAGTGLERWYRQGRYKPYDDEVMTDLTASIKSIVPEYVRISRVLRDIPSRFIVGGMRDSLRDVVRKRMEQKRIACHCIRCREYGHRLRAGFRPGEPHLKRVDYEASGGKEVFLSFEDDEGTLFGLLRLRWQPEPVPALAKFFSGQAAIIRELHVFGPEVPLNEKRAEAAQHRGIGRSLLLEAERIAREEFRTAEIFVLSGIGAREYYRKNFGYTQLGDYLVKELRTG